LILSLLLFGTIAAVLALILPLVASELRDLVTRLPELLDRAKTFYNDRILPLAADLGIDSSQVNPQDLGSLVGSLDRSASRLLSFGLTLFDLALLFFLTPVVTFYLLRDWPGVLDELEELVPRQSRPTVVRLVREIDGRLAGYIRGQSLVCLIEAVVFSSGFFMVGMPFALILGLSCGAMAAIPVLGNMVMVVVTTSIALAQSGDVVKAGLVLGIFAAVQALEQGFLAPKLIGDRVGLHPVWIIFALLIGGHLFGVVGALLALPAATALGVLVRFAVERYRQSRLHELG
jgi:predicted PurR-regulated permease PerM